MALHTAAGSRGSAEIGASTRADFPAQTTTTFKPTKTSGRNQYSASQSVELPLQLSLQSPAKDVFVVSVAHSHFARAQRSELGPRLQAALALTRQLEQQGYLSMTEKSLLKQIIATANLHTLNILLGALMVFQQDQEQVPELVETLKVVISSKNLL